MPLFMTFLNNLTIESRETGQNLWGSQIRVLQTLADGMDQGIRDFTFLKSRQLGECLTPETKILRADLTWTAIGDLRPGDELVSVDEYPLEQGKGYSRKMRTGLVEATINHHRDDTYDIIFDDGRLVSCTGTHPWLVRTQGSSLGWGTINRRFAHGENTEPNPRLKIGSVIRWVTKPWASPNYEDGWFGGMLDGEGSAYWPEAGGGNVSVSQKEGPVWDRMVNYAEARGYHYRIEKDLGDRPSKFGDVPVPKLCFGRADEILRLFGQTRPTREPFKYDFWDGRDLPGKKSGIGWSRIIEIIPRGRREVVDLQTSVGTYIAEGFVSHNTSLCLAIDLFWLFMHPGINGCIVIDEESNRDKIRVVLREYARSLPKGMRYPIVDDNKTLMSFNVGGKLSILDFLYAGKRRSTLGASRSYRFAHLSEVANYGDEEGLENFIQTLSENDPDRLFIKESTANHFNHFYWMCKSAKEDIHTQRFCFIGWWSRPDQRIARSDPRYREYMHGQPWTEEEKELRHEVSHHYGVVVDDEQLAWYRWRSHAKSLDEAMMMQTQPWTERQAFVLSGRSFFPLKKVTKGIDDILRQGADDTTYDFTAYRYYLGNSFDMTTIEQVFAIDEADLKIWEEPLPWGRYVIGVDPAYGRSDWNDSHAITVCRCFADKLVTVAEYGTSEPETFQVTWALAHLASMYDDCYINIEVKGPGTAIMTELRRMKQILQSSLMSPTINKKSWQDILDGMKWYLYNRPDSLGKGYAYGINTTVDIKIAMMNELRDSYTNDLIFLKSLRCLEQMQLVTQDGADIGAGASGRDHDDFVFSLMFAHRAWLEWVRPTMIEEGYTFERAMMEDQNLREGRRPHFVSSMITQFFNDKDKERKEAVETYRPAWAGPPVGTQR